MFRKPTKFDDYCRKLVQEKRKQVVENTNNAKLSKKTIDLVKSKEDEFKKIKTVESKAEFMRGIINEAEEPNISQSALQQLIENEFRNIKRK